MRERVIACESQPRGIIFVNGLVSVHFSPSFLLQYKDVCLVVTTVQVWVRLFAR